MKNTNQLLKKLIFNNICSPRFLKKNLKHCSVFRLLGREEAKPDLLHYRETDRQADDLRPPADLLLGHNDQLEGQTQLKIYVALLSLKSLSVK